MIGPFLVFAASGKGAAVWGQDGGGLLHATAGEPTCPHLDPLRLL